MKKIFLLCTALLLAVFVKAQDIGVVNTGCQAVVVYLYGNPTSSCAAGYVSTGYYVAAGSTLKLSMYPGGAYPPTSWTSPIPAGSQFTALKIFDPAMAWGASVGRPCFSSGSFGPRPGCGIQATSNWTNPSLVIINLF